MASVSVRPPQGGLALEDREGEKNTMGFVLVTVFLLFFFFGLLLRSVTQHELMAGV